MKVNRFEIKEKLLKKKRRIRLQDQRKGHSCPPSRHMSASPKLPGGSPKRCVELHHPDLNSTCRTPHADGVLSSRQSWAACTHFFLCCLLRRTFEREEGQRCDGQDTQTGNTRRRRVPPTAGGTADPPLSGPSPSRPLWGPKGLLCHLASRGSRYFLQTGA